MEILPIAHFHSPFQTKFGIPRQSGLVEELEGTIVFEPTYRHAEALRGLEDFDYIWLIWEFSGNSHQATSLTVRPPRLGGNTRLGVFATRSPFRPNRLGLSAVKVSHVEWESAQGPIIHVLGGDLMDGTPIYDIKPYVAYADSHPEARSGFVDSTAWKKLDVLIPDTLRQQFPDKQLRTLVKILEQDPRPHYHDDPERTYGMVFGGRDIRFKVTGNQLVVV